MLYINGSSVAITFSVTTDKTIWINALTGLDTARIGHRNYDSGGGDLFYSGQIDELRIYNRALSSAEVTKNYNHGKSKHS